MEMEGQLTLEMVNIWNVHQKFLWWKESATVQIIVLGKEIFRHFDFCQNKNLRPNIKLILVFWRCHKLIR